MSDILNLINQSLSNKKVRRFLISLFVDTRLADGNIQEQILREPRGVTEALALAKTYHNEFPQAIRQTSPALYKISVKIEDTIDDLERIAIWAGYLEQQTG